MTITLSQETEARLREKAQREGEDVNVVAEGLIALALDWETEERAETLAGVRRGDKAAAEGRERPLAEFLAEQRNRHGFASDWPHGVEVTADAANRSSSKTEFAFARWD